MSAKIQFPKSARRRILALWVPVAVASLLIFGATAVSGYVLRGPHLLALVAKKLAGPKSLTVHQHITIEDPLLSDTPVGMSEEVNYLFPDQFRSEIWHENTHRIFVLSRGQALSVVDDRIVATREGRFDRYKDLLLYRSRQALHTALLQNGVDVGVTSLGRLDQRVVYIIGAQYPDDSVSQVWIDKERLLPMRWLTVLPADRDDGQGDRLEFTYRQWQQLDGAWYPMLIESHFNGQRLRTIRVRRVEADKAIPGELLNISHLMSIYTPKEDARDADQAPASDVDEVERTIEDFRKKFEP